MGFNLDDYEPVADRIERFWNDHPKGSIVTLLVAQDEKRFVVKAFVCKETTEVYWQGDKTNADATGYAEEIIGSTNVNRTSALENCETSAIGRALANLGYAVKNRASREEMAKAQPEPRPRSGGRKVTPTPQAPESHTNGSTGSLADVVAAYAKEQVAGFSRFSESEQADSYKRHSKAVLDGKPISLEEVDKVVKAMREEYQSRFPDALPV